MKRRRVESGDNAETVAAEYPVNALQQMLTSQVTQPSDKRNYVAKLDDEYKSFSGHVQAYRARGWLQ